MSCSIFRTSPLINEENDFNDIKFIVIYDDAFSLSEIEKMSKGFAYATDTYREDLAEYKTAYDNKPHYYITFRTKGESDPDYIEFRIEYNSKRWK